jgi:hypothetical protein
LSHSVDNSAPTVAAANPARGDFGVPVSSTIVIRFDKAMRTDTVSSSTFLLRDSDDRVVPAMVNYQSRTHKAILMPSASLAYSAIYKVTIVGGPSGVQDNRGKALVRDLSWTFATAAPPPPPHRKDLVVRFW